MMKVILKQDIKGLGKKGDIVNAKDGYVRNFLIPKGWVEEATPVNIAQAKAQQKSREVQKQREREEAEALAEKLSQSTLILKEKAAEDGRLYGSVTTKDISQALEHQIQVKVDKRKILLEEPIRHIGDSTVGIKVYPEVTGSLKVRVEAE